MQQGTARVAAAQTSDSTKLYMESTLLRIAGALFCHDPKNAGKRTGEIELNRGVIDKHIVIRPDPRLGQPGPLAHKMFVALLKKHSDYGKPIRKEISFTRREIGRLIGRKEWGGRAIEAAAGPKALSFNGSLGQAMRTRAIYSLTIERHGDRIKSFEQWRSER